MQGTKEYTTSQQQDESYVRKRQSAISAAAMKEINTMGEISRLLMDLSVHAKQEAKLRSEKDLTELTVVMLAF
jgi:hypothetical protein